MDNNTKEKLIELQKVIYRKSIIEKDIDDIPKALDTKIEILNRLKKNFLDRNNILNKKIERLEKLKDRYNSIENKKTEYEKQIGASETNQRESEILEKQIRDLQIQEAEAQKNIEKEKKEYDDLRSELKDKEAMILSQENEITEEKNKINSEINSRKKKLEDLIKKETSIIPDLNKEIIYKFERIVKKKGGLAIVPIKKNVCTGCHIILTSQFINDVRDDASICFCPHCSRVLYYEHTDETEENFNFDDKDTGALADLNPDIEF